MFEVGGVQGKPDFSGIADYSRSVNKIIAS